MSEVRIIQNILAEEIKLRKWNKDNYGNPN